MIYKYNDKVEEHEAAEAFDSICEMFAVMKNAETRCKQALDNDLIDQYRLNLQIYDDANAILWDLIEPFLDCDEVKEANVKPVNFCSIIKGYEKQIKFLEEENAALTKATEAYGLEYGYSVEELKEMYKEGGRKID